MWCRKSRFRATPLAHTTCFLVLAALFNGCAPTDPTSIQSPSGKYRVFATIEEVSLIHIHLTNSEGVELDAVYSGASDAMKWALGWMTDEDVVVLQSSDVGTRAYDILDNHLVARPEAFKDEAIRSRADELRSEKYR